MHTGFGPPVTSAFMTSDLPSWVQGTTLERWQAAWRAAPQLQDEASVRRIRIEQAVREGARLASADTQVKEGKGGTIVVEADGRRVGFGIITVGNETERDSTFDVLKGATPTPCRSAWFPSPAERRTPRPFWTSRREARWF